MQRYEKLKRFLAVPCCCTGDGTTMVVRVEQALTDPEPGTALYLTVGRGEMQ